MKIGIVTPDIKNDLMSAELFETLSFRADAIVINPCEISYQIGDRKSIMLGKHKHNYYDAVILRRLSEEGNTDFQYNALYRCENDGLLIINSLRSLELTENKFLTTTLLSQYSLPVPNTIVCQNLNQLKIFWEQYGDIVIKPVYGDLGRGLVRIKNRNKLNSAGDLFKDEGVVFAQQFIRSKGKDYRLFVVGDYVVAGIERIAEKGWITNIFRGANAKKFNPDQRLRDLCIKACQIIGLDYCGVDVIFDKDKPLILELNGSPSWGGLSNASGRDIAEDITSHVIKTIKERKKRQIAS